MRKVIAVILIISLLSISLVGCSVIPGLSQAPKSTPAKVVTPTLMDRVQALEVQNLSLSQQLSKANSDIQELQKEVDRLKALIK